MMFCLHSSVNADTGAARVRGKVGYSIVPRPSGGGGGGGGGEGGGGGGGGDVLRFPYKLP